MQVCDPGQRIQVEFLHPAAQLPTRAYDGDAGFDLRCVESFALDPGERSMVGTGIALVLPAHTACLVLPRSGLAARHGLTVVNGPGLIDPNYRGEVRVLLINFGDLRFHAHAGDRIAQLLFVPLLPITLTQEPPLVASSSTRGANGFGSSGV
jgi:dUTP pyrophosphatase